MKAAFLCCISALSLGIYSLSLNFSQKLIEEHLIEPDLGHIVGLAIQRKRNLEPLSRMIASYGLGLTTLVEFSCEHWSYETYETVRSFVTANRQYEHLLLSPWCVGKLKLSPMDIEANKRDMLHCSLLYYLFSERFEECSKGLEIIEQLDPAGFFRSDYGFNVRMFEFFLQSPSDQLLNTPVHAYLTTDLIERGLGDESSAILLAEYVRHQRNLAVLCKVATIALRRIDALNVPSNQIVVPSGPNVMIYDKVMANIVDAFKELKVDISGWFHWQHSEDPRCSIPDVFDDFNSLEFLQMAMIIAYRLGQDPPLSLQETLRKRLEHLNDYDFAETVNLAGWTKTCHFYIDDNNVRIMGLHRVYWEAGRYIGTCLTSTQIVQRFQRWQRRLPPKKFDISNEAVFNDYTRSPTALFMVPPSNPETQLRLAAELEGLMKKLRQLTRFREEGDSYYLSIVQVTNFEMESYVYRLHIIWLLLKLHYSGSGYELDRDYLRRVLCDPKEERHGIYSDPCFHVALDMAYSIVCS
jgi:hypothetical protein